MRAAMRTVRRGGESCGKSGGGASSASDRPFTPSFFHASLARVGPRSAPPCSFDPPTRVGATASACFAHCEAPGQPFSAIRSFKLRPTVVLRPLGAGHAK